MTITRLPLSSLRLPEKNVRKHTDKQIGEYIRSIKMFGVIKPIVVDETGEIICGNGLYLALQQMGETECDCYVMELTEAQKKKLMLADNRVYELGVTDFDAFQDLIRDLDGDIDVPGWDDDLLSALTASMQDVDDMVSDYGTFSPEDTSRINRVEVSRVETPPYPPLQQAHTGETVQAPISDRVEIAPQETHASGLPGRTIICPHCGGTICL